MAAFASSFALFLKEVGGGEDEEEDGEGRRSMLVMAVVVVLVLWRQACKAACSLAVVYVWMY